MMAKTQAERIQKKLVFAKTSPASDNKINDENDPGVIVLMLMKTRNLLK